MTNWFFAWLLAVVSCLRDRHESEIYLLKYVHLQLTTVTAMKVCDTAHQDIVTVKIPFAQGLDFTSHALCSQVVVHLRDKSKLCEHSAESLCVTHKRDKLKHTGRFVSCHIILYMIKVISSTRTNQVTWLFRYMDTYFHLPQSQLYLSTLVHWISHCWWPYTHLEGYVSGCSILSKRAQAHPHGQNININK